MKRLFLVLLGVYFLIGLSCQEKGTEPQPSYPPGYQHDIPWPSLADSPWPMNHGNPQSTGRSKYKGATLGIISWSLDSTYLNNSMAINQDTNLVFLNAGPKYGLFIIDMNGKIVSWKKNIVEFGKYHSVPLVGRDGTIYYTGGWVINKLFALKKSGEIKWEFLTDAAFDQTGINIGLDETIYCITKNGTLYAINPNGTEKWKFNYSDFANGQIVISFSPDGKTLYIPGNQKTIHAFDIETKSIKWSFGNGRSYAAPIVDSYGNVYLLTQTDNYSANQPALISLKNDGTVNWSYIHNNVQQSWWFGYSEGCIDKFGNIFFAFDTLYSVSFQGKLNWKKSLNGRSLSPLVCDVEGRIYLVIVREGGIIDFVCYKNDGNILWQLPAINHDVPGLSPVLANEKIIFGSYSGLFRMYCIE